MLQSLHIDYTNSQGGTVFGQPDQPSSDDSQATAPATDAPQQDAAWSQQDQTVTPTEQTEPAFDPGSVSTDAPAPSDDQPWQHPGTPLDGATEPAAPQPISDVISPAGGFPKPPSFPAPSNSTPPDLIPPTPPMPPSDQPSDTSAPQDLTEIKQHALEELAPLVDDLQQNPEDHFRTLMMLIQASDDQSLLPKAYEAAHKIEDEQVRAQALLDVVNEINYFTQPHTDGESPAEN